MTTLVKRIDPANMVSQDFAEAVSMLREGKLVAFPTETVYGLGGDAFDPTASQRIYAAKGRPSDNPLIVHIAGMEELEKIACDIPQEAYILADKFWPGPLTMIFKKRDEVPKETTGGLDTVAVRMPSHPVARRLILESGLAIAAPSANVSGRPSTTKAEHVIEDLDGRIDMIIDGGASDIGLESTIVDLTCKPVLILRPGYITIEMLQEVIPDIAYDKAVLKRVRDDSIVAKAPGMKYRHYAPKGDLTIYEGMQEAVLSAITGAVSEKLAEGFRVGILASEELIEAYRQALGSSAGDAGNTAGKAEGTSTADAGNTAGKAEGTSTADAGNTAGKAERGNTADAGNLTIESVGSRDDEAGIAAKLFDLLRDFDTKKIDFIYAEGFKSSNLGQAIMNRLLKAAGYRIVEV